MKIHPFHLPRIRPCDIDLIDHTLLVRKLLTLDIPYGTTCWVIDFLKNRQQRVKLERECMSEWRNTPAGIPQGTKLGPWPLTQVTPIYEICGDTTMAENVVKTKASTIQNDVDELVEKSKENRFQLNVAKCKEQRISFAKHSVDLEPILVNGEAINVAHTVKLLGLNISSDLRWNCHVSEISQKFASRLYFLRQLKRANIPTKDLLTFYITCVRPVAEYALIK